MSENFNPLTALKKKSLARYYSRLCQPLSMNMRTNLALIDLFHLEVSDIVYGTSEPGLADIKLHWWGEVIDGKREAERLASPFAQAFYGIVNGDENLKASVLEMITSRQAILFEPLDSQSEHFERYLYGMKSLPYRMGVRELGGDSSIQQMKVAITLAIMADYAFEEYYYYGRQSEGEQNICDLRKLEEIFSQANSHLQNLPKRLRKAFNYFGFLNLMLKKRRIIAADYNNLPYPLTILWYIWRY